MRVQNRFILTFFLFIASTTVLLAQEQEEKDLTIDVSADVVSQYVWRGQDLGDVSFQPSLDVTYKGLYFNVWGSVGLSDPDDTKEIDLQLSYTMGNFTIGVIDYWTDEGQDPRKRFFKYDAHGTNHVFEASLGYDFSPVAFQWFTNFTGNDGLTKKGKRAYSSYFELAVPFKLAGLDWTATAGAVPYATSFYQKADKFAVTNLSLKAEKEIKVTEKFHIPLFAEFDANPSTQKAYFVFGLKIKP